MSPSTQKNFRLVYEKSSMIWKSHYLVGSCRRTRKSPLWSVTSRLGKVTIEPEKVAKALKSRRQAGKSYSSWKSFRRLKKKLLL